jgi:hypothetical protein
MCFSPDGSPLQRGIQTASPSLGSTSDGFSPPSSPPPLYSEVFDDVDYPEAYSPICYDPGEDEDSRENEHEDDVEEDEEASTVSWDTSEDKNSEHVSILNIFLTFGIFKQHILVTCVCVCVHLSAKQVIVPCCSMGSKGRAK